MLRFPLGHNVISQRDIALELRRGSTVSLDPSVKRRLNHDYIVRLSRCFNVSPAVFFGAVSA